METKPIAVSLMSGKQGYASLGDLWSWPSKPGRGSGDFTRAGMTSNVLTQGRRMIHPLLPLTIGGGRLYDYRKVIQELGGLLRLTYSVWGRNDTVGLFST